jgi:hypothetical protein
MKEERWEERVEERGEKNVIFFLISPLKLKVLESDAGIKLKVSSRNYKKFGNEDSKFIQKNSTALFSRLVNGLGCLCVV